jgi:transposase-like protein
VFSDPDSGDTHAASQWQITTKAGEYANPVFDNAHAVGSSLTSIAITTVSLNPSTTYYWRVRHQDNHGAWSDWSEEASFTTQSVPPDNPPVTTENHPPDRPLCLAPEDGASDASTTPTLEASAFHDSDVDDSQAASQWQITKTSEDYPYLTFDGAESANSITVPSETLLLDTTYYWRVRYQDSHGAWSEWSEESSFTTETEEQGDTTNRMAVTSWIYLAGVVAVAILAAATVAWRNARAARTASK